TQSDMGKAKKTRKFAEVKRMMSLKDVKPPPMKKTKPEDEVRHIDKTPSALFFRYNTQLGPPYQVLIDTNFINFSIRNKIDLVKGMMDCLYAECTPCICDCVMAELEKLGQKYRVALKIAKIPGVPIMYIQSHRYSIERLPEATMGGAPRT
ncbi:hypothetical protein APUTEX25_003736, partial [Auxenochlorella protothecoides]